MAKYYFEVQPASHGSKKRRGKSAQARLLELLFTNLPIFPRSRVMRGRSKCGFGNAPMPPQGCLRASHRVGCNRACALVIHDNDASWGDLTIRHLERRWNGAIGKQPFSTAQRQRVDLEPELIDQIMLHERLNEICTSVHVQIRPFLLLELADFFRNVSA